MDDPFSDGGMDWAQGIDTDAKGADVRGFPPSYLITGTRDLLLSDTVLMHSKLRRAGVEADLHVYEGHSHADYAILYDTPEAKENFAELKAFLTRHLKK
jgi:acetyl esterase/lipase